MGVKHCAQGGDCADMVNKYLTAAAALGFLCGVFAVLQELSRLLSTQFDGLPVCVLGEEELL